MAFSLRRLLISVVLGSLPLSAQAQGFGQLPAPAATGQAAQPGTGLTPRTIGNTTLQREQRTGRQTDQVLDPRTGLPIDPRTQQIIQGLQPPPVYDLLIDFLRGQRQAVAFMEEETRPMAVSALTTAELHAGVRDGSEKHQLSSAL
ncbi:MAG: hypothetical protein ACTS6J_20190 [Burkholderiales bacterium]